MYRQLDGKKEEFARSNSICLKPEEELLKSVLENDTNNIARILKSNTNLLEHIYGSKYNKPILLIACSETNVEAGTLDVLLKFGADVNYSSDLDEDWQALHFAARCTKCDTLQVIVDYIKKQGGNINTLAKGSNALHILIRYGNSKLTEEFVECTKILMQGGIDVNQGDGDGISPILWAAKKGFKEIIKTILECSESPIDIYTHKSRGKNARDLILEKNLYDGLLPDEINNHNESDADVLFKYLNSKNENAFVNFKNGNIFDLVNVDNTSSTLLQNSCEKHLKRAAEHLINKGADPNLVTSRNKKSPIEICADNGCYEIFYMLLDHNKIQVPNIVLVTLLKNLDNDELPGISHRKCYDALLEEQAKGNVTVDINETDESNNSPLHYAVRYTEPEIIEKLLHLGASLGSKNKYGVMPVQDMEPELLEKHLDNCIEFDVNGKIIEKENFTITFNYQTLMPPIKKIREKDASINIDGETNLIPQKLVAETEVISYISKAPEFKHLLKHPVIVSFLFMKWRRIQWLFYTNLAFYIAFFLSLVVYIFVWYANFNNAENSLFETFITNLSFGIFLITYIILILRELFQITVSPEKYFQNFENYVEIILIFFTGSILFISNPTDDTKRILSSVSILLAAFELVLMVGQHPKLSTNVVMLETVSFAFFKFLMWYSLLIIAFALSFYILFFEVEAESKNKTDNDDEENLFTDPGNSVFKTIVMLTGEFDAGSLKFHHFPVMSKLMFALFIFMIAIILVNLLNGLAVNDIQQIKNDAELVGHVVRTQHIRYVESMLLGNILPSCIFKKINEFCCCFPEASNSTFITPKLLARRACLFPHYLDYKLTIYPNKSGQIYLEKETSLFGRNCVYCCAYIYLDKETVKRTKRIIYERREALKMNNEDNQLQQIRNIFEAFVENDRREIFELKKKLDDVINYMSVKNNYAQNA